MLRSAATKIAAVKRFWAKQLAPDVSVGDGLEPGEGAATSVAAVAVTVMSAVVIPSDKIASVPGIFLTAVAVVDSMVDFAAVTVVANAVVSAPARGVMSTLATTEPAEKVTMRCAVVYSLGRLARTDVLTSVSRAAFTVSFCMSLV
jgi:hypothetical protein